MRYRRLSLLLVCSLVFLLLVSLVLICTWFYYYFYKSDENSAVTSYESLDSLSAIYTRDSLQRAYAHTLSSTDSAWSKADTSVKDIGSTLADYQRLRNEISGLLKQNSSRAELDTARLRIALLQQKIEELRNRTRAVENENKKLNEMVRQLSRELKEGEKEFRSASEAPDLKNISRPNNASPPISVTDVQLEIHPPQNEADKPGRVIGRFKTGNTSESGALYVIVLQPDKRILLNSDWETGSFNTSKGKKIYSVKIPLRSEKEGNNTYSFTLALENPLKGTYTAEIYHEGKMVAKGLGTQ